MKQAIEQVIHPLAKEYIDGTIENWLGIGANAKILSEFLWWIEDYLNNEVEMHNPETGEIIYKRPEEEVNQSIKQKWNAINEHYANAIVGQYEIAMNILSLFEDFVEENLKHPTFITDFPKVVSPLSKASPMNPAIAERFELFIAGLECGNGFSELNDPVEQYERFMDQTMQRERGDDEAMVLDEDYIRALSYGMPPAAGIGIGIDRLVMLLANQPLHTRRDSLPTHAT